MTAKFNLPDAVLLFLYADYNNRITGMSRLAACAYFLEVEIGLVPKGTVKIGSGGRGISSSEVNRAVNALLSSGHIDTTGHRNDTYYGIRISKSGVEYIWKAFRNLPDETIRLLVDRRRSLDTHTIDGVVNLLCTHYPDAVPESVIKRHGGRINWDDV